MTGINENYDFPKYAKKGEDLPRRTIYRVLRQIYLEEHNKTNKDLAELLETTPQSCSTMATGSDRRLPPYWIILRLCHLTGRELRLSPNGVEIIEVDDI